MEKYSYYPEVYEGFGGAQSMRDIPAFVPSPVPQSMPTQNKRYRDISNMSQEDIDADIKKRNGGLDPGNKGDHLSIKGYLERKAYGQLDPDEERTLITLNPKIASIMRGAASGQRLKDINAGLPAPLVLTNEEEKALAAGDTKRADRLRSYAKVHKIVKIGGVEHVILPAGNEGVPTAVPLSTLERETGAKSALAAAEASGTVEGKDAGAARVSLKTADIDAAQVIKLTDELVNHPGARSSTGIFSLIDKPAPGTAQANWVAKYQQLQGTLFKQAYETLKGGGQITEIESKQAREAIAAMSRAQSYEDFVAEAEKFKEAVRIGLEKLHSRAGTKMPKGPLSPRTDPRNPSPSPSAPSSGNNNDPLGIR